jgi:cytochrome c peroxidase
LACIDRAAGSGSDNGRGAAGAATVPIPVGNPQTVTRIKLGGKLFHDARLSADGKVSCSTCHDQAKGFTDHLQVSTGFNERSPYLGK